MKIRLLGTLSALVIAACSTSQPAGDTGASVGTDNTLDDSGKRPNKSTDSSDAGETTGASDAGHDSGVDVSKVEEPACTAMCDSSKVCMADLCCPPPTKSGTFKLPTHTNYVHWTLTKRVAKLEFVVDFKNDPGAKVGLYYSPYNAEIDGTQFYFGIQTDLIDNNAGGVHRGHGVTLSQFGTLDKASIKTVAGGFSEVGTHEGEFIGIRLPYAWTKGSYRIRLERGAAEGAADWFELHMVAPNGLDTLAGALKFARATAGTPATIQNMGTSFTEVYSGATDYANVPKWRIDTMAYGDDLIAKGALGEYPNYPEYPGIPSFPNTDIAYNASGKLVELRYGGDTAKCHPAGKLF